MWVSVDYYFDYLLCIDRKNVTAVFRSHSYILHLKIEL